MVSAPLAQIQILLRHTAPPRLLALTRVADLLSSFLDMSVSVSLVKAAGSGSVRLFERVASRVQRSDSQRLVDPALVEHWFARAMQTAIEKNDLVMVQLIHAFHPEPLVLYTLQLSLQHGDLEMVQWIIQHRHDRMCCPPGVTSMCKSCWLKALSCIGQLDPCRIVQWASDQGLPITTTQLRPPLFDAMLRSVTLVEWYHQSVHISVVLGYRLLCEALKSSNSSVDVIRYLVDISASFSAGCPRPDDLVRALVVASCQENKEDSVSYVLATTHLQRIASSFLYSPTRPNEHKVLRVNPAVYKQPAARVFDVDVEDALCFQAQRFGHVDTIRWLLQERGRKRVSPYAVADEDEALALYKWMHEFDFGLWSKRDMDSAASRGFLRVVQWLHESRREGCSTNAMYEAALNGHLEVIQWLHEHRSEGCLSSAMDKAAYRGHLDIVQWLHANRREGCSQVALNWSINERHYETVRWLCEHYYPHRVRPSLAMTRGAVTGDVELLQCVVEASEDCCMACCLKELLCQPHANSMSGNESYQILNTLRWLDAHQPDKPCGDGCSQPPPPRFSNRRSITIQAAIHGDLQLLEYLHQHHSEEFAQNLQESPPFIAQGLVGDQSARMPGHLRIAQWFHSHYPEIVDWNEVSALLVDVDKDELGQWEALLH